MRHTWLGSTSAQFFEGSPRDVVYSCTSCEGMFMAPEIFQESVQQSQMPAMDMWAAGVLLHLVSSTVLHVKLLGRPCLLCERVGTSSSLATVRSSRRTCQR